ncbi:hypothetical protein [Streptomyces sp. RerS4]|uniref:hypothetical protein n=1 Tax=Streptomyces sp. RerS4 TaxID=2942449 RepID=UPI00201BC06A|nr:hypothetical protein [Streptomyces sp. RerS4]UQX00166.1 hypothetical protein M4D82_06140 [Streptomyces sp. RerS4]
MVLLSAARPYTVIRRPGARRRDLAPGAEVVGAWQALTVWALLLVTRDAADGSSVALAVGAPLWAAAGFLHGLLLVKPLAWLGRLTARLCAWPEPVALTVLAVAVSAAPAALVHWWLAGQVAPPAPGFGQLWALTTAGAVLPLVAGALLRGRRVPARVLWARGAVVACTTVGVVALTGLVRDLPL